MRKLVLIAGASVMLAGCVQQYDPYAAAPSYAYPSSYTEDYAYEPAPYIYSTYPYYYDHHRYYNWHYWHHPRVSGRTSRPHAGGTPGGHMSHAGAGHERHERDH